MRLFLAIACGLVPLLALGCGKAAESADNNVKRQTEGKVEAMKQLADALEKNDKPAIAAAIEGLTSNSLDPVANPAAAAEFMDVYTKRVKGKVRGEEAVQVKAAVDGVESQMKK